jgi:general stress protein 26
MSSSESTSQVAQLVKNARISMFTTMSGEGKHVSRPMALQEAEFDGHLWFFCYDDSAKVGEIAENPQVNVSFADNDNSSWTSISGTAEVVHDRARAEEMWAAPLKVWFPDGVETPGLTMISVHADSAEYWDSPSSKVRQLVGAVRAAVTGDPDKFPGTNETVEL